MQKLILILLLIVSSFSLFGQKRGAQKIILNDGSQITGTIVEDSSDELKIKVTKPQVITVSKSQVNSIQDFHLYKQINPKDKGYYIQFSSSMLAGKNDFGEVYTTSFQLSNGYQFSNGLSVGVGSGIENFDISLLPVYADISFFPFNWRISPSAYIRTGYSFALAQDEMIYYDSYYGNGSDYKGGFMFNAGFGLTMYTWQRAAVSIGVGYLFQRISFKRNFYWWNLPYSNEYITDFNRFELKLGFLFR